MPFYLRDFEGNCLETIQIQQDSPPDPDCLHCREPAALSGGGGSVLWTIFVILLILWLLGFSFHVAGGLIHLLLVIAAVVLIINLLTGRRTAV